ncbi:MAG: hypothetical protein ACOH2A_03055 [Sphingobacteriaceae bacterium]
MKTSYKLMIVIVFLVLSALMIYNVQLVKAYNARSNIYYGYEKMAIGNFTKIDVQAGYVQLIQGPFAVHIHKAAQQMMTVELKGDQLVVQKNDLVDRRITQDKYDLIISCPDLQLLKMDAKIFKREKEASMLYTYFNDGYSPNMIDINNFTQDSLIILQDNATLVNLNNNRIGKLKAKLGISKRAGSMLRLDSTNQIQQADIAVREASKLILDNS